MYDNHSLITSVPARMCSLKTLHPKYSVEYEDPEQLSCSVTLVHQESDMKTIVENIRENEKTPFLRGILIRSLMDAGLAFEDAYEISGKIRNSISDRKKINRATLKNGDRRTSPAYSAISAVPVLFSRIMTTVKTPRLVKR